MRHRLPACLFEGERSPLMRCSNHPHSWIELSITMGDFDGAIGRAIVPNQEFKVRMGLAQDAVKGGSKILLPIVDGDDKGDGSHWKR